MIIYKLICNNCQNLFDSWFSSSEEYEKLKKKRFINCYICNSINVEKTLMAPNISRAKNDFRIDNQDLEYKKVKKTIIEYQRFIKKNFNYVGKNFTYEARSLHYKDKKTSKGIYGTATKEELKELKEDGIKVEVLPWIKNNTN